MKKIIGIGIAVLMVAGMCVAANATSSAWTLLLKAGNGTTFIGSEGIVQVGIAATAAAPTYFSGAPTNVQCGLYCIDADPNKYGNKDIRAAGLNTYTWNMRITTGTSWTAQQISLGWNFPNAASAPGSTWSFSFYRKGSLFATFADSGANYSGTTLNAIANTADFGATPAGITEDWQLVASSGVVVTPEPGSVVAMLSGLVGLAGYGIRRRK